LGKRYLEIEIPVPPNAKKGSEVSKAFRNYYQTIAVSRAKLIKYLDGANPSHHFFVSGAERLAEEVAEAAE
jgi:hypothetical protein